MAVGGFHEATNRIHFHSLLLGTLNSTWHSGLNMNGVKKMSSKLSIKNVHLKCRLLYNV